MRHRFGTAVRTCVTLCSNALSRFTSFRLRSARNVRAHSRKPDACRWWRHTIKGAEDTTCSVFMRALTALTNTLRYAYQALARVNVHGLKCTALANTGSRQCAYTYGNAGEGKERNVHDSIEQQVPRALLADHDLLHFLTHRSTTVRIAAFTRACSSQRVHQRTSVSEATVPRTTVAAKAAL